MVESSEHSHLERLLDDAQAYLDAGETDQAIAVLREAYKIDPQNLRACSLLGFCALHKGKVDDAKKYFSFVAKMDPDNASARLGLKRVADHMAAPPVPAASQLVVPKQVEPAEDILRIPVSLATRLHIYFGCAVNGVILGTIFVLAARAWFDVEQTDAGEFGFSLMAGAAIGGFIGLLFVPRTIRKYREQTAAKGKNTRPVGQAAKQPMHNQAVTSQKRSTVTLIIAGILWLPSLALGAFLGGLIGNEIGGDGGAILGAIVGIVSIQAVYVALFPRRG